MMTDPALSEEAELRYEFKLDDRQEDNYKTDVGNAITPKKYGRL